MSIDLDGIMTDHMKDQPYSIRCTCGKELVVTEKDIDSDYDLDIVLEPCECNK